MKRNNPEILAPGGDFNSAVHALNSGADAVYIGLTSFSARKRAKNFTMDDLRRLKTFCTNNTDNPKKIYVAINTLLHDSELLEIYPIIKELEEIAVDAIIVQDLGLASLIKQYSNLEIHASTQLAVHNIHGAQALNDIGFSRAVLSRELSLNEIKKIKERFPLMELEIFIHGALCYGFSGLCLASSKILGRSANRGECGQICRTWFNNNGKKEYCFSMNDLSLKEKILKLKEIGVESLKIEGRMKGPGYASATSELYYNILHGKDFQDAQKRTETLFNRSGGDAYLTSNKGGHKINQEYPGHLGTKFGEIIDIKSDSFTVKTGEDIENRDGLMVLSNIVTIEPVKLGANILEKKTGTIKFKGKLPKNIDKTIYKISSHDKHLKEEKPQKYKPWKSDINLGITINNDGIIIRAENKNYNYPIVIEKANSKIDIDKLFKKTFYAGGETKYHFPCKIVSCIENPFIPSSKLKDIRNSFQQDFIEGRCYNSLEVLSSEIPVRSFIKNREILPFITNFRDVNSDNLIKEKDEYLLPLAPVVFDSEEYLKSLLCFLDINSDKNFIIGLNNVGQLEYVKKLPENYNYYCDYGLFSLNSYSKHFLIKSIKNLKWVTKWVEEDKDIKFPPLFISRTCFKSQEKGCPANCNKKFEFEVSQNGKQKVIVRDCISYTITASESS